MVFDRFRDSMLKGYELVAAPVADLRDRICASQAIVMLSDPVVLFGDAAVDELRRDYTDRDTRRGFEG